MSDPGTLNLVLEHMDLEVTPDFGSGALEGKVTLSVRNEGPDPVVAIPLQLGRLMSVHEAVGDGKVSLCFEQDIVTYRDEPRLQVNQLQVQLTEPLAPQHVCSVQVAYSGVLVGYTEVGWRYVRDHVDSEFTILREDAFAFPVLGLPSTASQKAMPRKDFSYTARITVPADLTVSLGSEATRTTQEDGLSVWDFRSGAPVPFLNIAVARYSRITDRGVAVFHFPADEVGAQRVMKSVHRVIDLYSEWFGPLSERPRFHITEIPEGWGSQTSLTAGVILTADSFSLGANLIGLYHELAHLWHPHDLETPAPRWNEGLASFLQHRVAQDLDGAEQLEDRMGSIWNSLRDHVQEEPALQSVPMIQDGTHLLTEHSYTVGRLMFYVLYEFLGHSEFDQAMGRYFQVYRDSGTTTDQFMEFVAAHASADPRPVFDDWLCTAQWAERLIGGESLRQVVDSYRR